MAVPLEIDLGVLGWADSLILMVLALVVFGPRRLPEIGRQIGRLMYEFRKASNDFKFQMEEELRAAEEADRRKKQEEDRLKAEALKAAATPALPPPEPSNEVGRPESESAADAHGGPARHLDEPAPPTEPLAESTYPAIHPPSTGEPIPALKPYRAAGDSDLQSAGGSESGEHGPAGRESSGANGAADGSEPVGEQAAHHG